MPDEQVDGALRVNLLKKGQNKPYSCRGEICGEDNATPPHANS
jgi:hypothetical protein